MLPMSWNNKKAPAAPGPHCRPGKAQSFEMNMIRLGATFKSQEAAGRVRVTDLRRFNEERMVFQ